METIKNFFLGFSQVTHPNNITVDLGNLEEFIFFVEKGYLKRMIVDNNGLEFILGLKHPNTILPLTTGGGEFIKENIYQTISPVKLRRVLKRDFQKFLSQNPVAMEEYTQLLTDELMGCQKRIVTLATGSISTKIFYVLSLYADLLGHTKEKEIEIQFPLTHDEIASWIGVTRETVSICLKKLQNKGLIRYNRKTFTLKNYQLIKELQVSNPKDF